LAIEDQEMNSAAMVLCSTKVVDKSVENPEVAIFLHISHEIVHGDFAYSSRPVDENIVKYGQKSLTSFYRSSPPQQ
jgi:hypothetical protein